MAGDLRRQRRRWWQLTPVGRRQLMIDHIAVDLAKDLVVGKELRNVLDVHLVHLDAVRWLAILFVLRFGERRWAAQGDRRPTSGHNRGYY